MPTEDDINEEREALQLALGEFVQREHGERIVSQYSELPDVAVFDAGLYGQQVRQKRELARIAAEALGPDAQLARPRRRGYVGRARRWIKRAKVLVGSLKGLIPGAEALDELLDLLDGALDRR
jgi:hypothetical protein